MKVPCPRCRHEVDAPGNCQNCNTIITVLTEPLGDLTKPEPPPQPGSAPHSVDLLKGDLDGRKAHGIEKYGVAHQWDNGRDHLVDAYQEAQDCAVYLAAELRKRAAARAMKAQMLARLVGVDDGYNLFSVREIKALLELI